jgi:hypothetical protein
VTADPVALRHAHRASKPRCGDAAQRKSPGPGAEAESKLRKVSLPVYPPAAERNGGGSAVRRAIGARRGERGVNVSHMLP